MVSLDDCIALSGLSRTAIRRIAAHQHCPEIVAVGIGWSRRAGRQRRR